MDSKINKNMTQEHLVTTQAHRRVPGKPGATMLTAEYPAYPHSSVEQQDTNRRDTVKKLIQQFESHPNKQSFLQDLNKTGEIFKLSEKSEKLIADMNNTEIFELCETSSEKAMLRLCSFFARSALSIVLVVDVFSICAKNKELDKNNYDVLSIPGHVIKKNTIRGAKHGLSERQGLYCKAKEMLQKARQPKHEG